MSGQIAHALEDAAKKAEQGLAKDFATGYHDILKDTEEKTGQVADHAADNEAKTVEDLGKAGEHPRTEVTDPYPAEGGTPDAPSPRGDEPSGSGRDQVSDPHDAGRPPDAVCDGGEPVDMATGRMFIDQTDAFLPGSLPLEFTRCFESGYRAGRWMGRRWVCTFDERLEIDDEGVVHLGADRRTQAYPHPDPGTPVRATAGARRDLSVDYGERGYTLTDRASGLVREFTVQPGGREALLTRLGNRNGDHYTLAYDRDGTPQAITHSGGYRLLVTVADGRITELLLAGAAQDGGDQSLLRYGYTDGHLSEVHNSSGLAMRFANDAWGRITSWTDRNDSHYQYVYDAAGRVLDEGGADGSLHFAFRYGDPDPDTGLRTHTETDALGHTTAYEVNERHQIVAITDPLGNTTRYERDFHDRLLAETNPLGHTTRYTYDGAGDLISVTRPDGERSDAAYAHSLSLPTTVTAPGGATWRQTYDDHGRRTTLTDPLGAVTRYEYDGLGHLASVTDGLGWVTRLRCDAAGLPVEVTGPTGATTRFERDAFGRSTAVTDPLGGVTRMAWTVEGRLALRTTPDGAAESWTYDGEGNMLARTDQLGRTTTYEYTHFETLAARTTPDGARHSFGYDRNMRLVAVADPLGRQWTYAYDPAGRVVSECDFNGRTVNYGFDASGCLTEVTDPRGRQTRYGYDRLGRVVAKDADGRVSTYAYDAAGHLIGAANPDAELSRTVDALGNLLTETVNGRTLVHHRDVLGRRTRRIMPTGHTSDWTYDGAGRATGLATSGGTLDFSYDAAGRECERTVGGSVTLSSSWDGRHRLTAQSLRSSSATLRQRGYRYQADGSLIGITDRTAAERTFELDRTGRVTAVRAEDWNETYAYDPTGNLVDARWPAGGAADAALGARTYEGTQLATAGRVRYEYDASGRTVVRQKTRLSRKPDTWHYAWDSEDRLTGVVTPDGTSWRYRYDPLGRRISKERLSADGSAVEERVEFTWDGSHLAEQTTHAPYLPGPYTLSWDHRGWRPLAQTETITSRTSEQDRIDRRFFAIVTDLAGAPTELVDPATEGVSWQATKTLWGNTTWPRDSAAYTPLRFPGQYFDPETRLHYNLHRYYDPETARYATPDPLGLAPAPNPDTYVHNPHTWSDPLGLSPHAPMKWDPAKIDEKYDKHVLGQGKRPGESADMPEYKDQDDDDDGFSRYEQDAEGLMNGPLTPQIREVTRSGDGAILRLHTPTGRLVIGQNGKITNFFRPDDPVKYMENESGR